MARALDALLRGQGWPARGKATPHVFKVAQEIIKHSDAFRWASAAARRTSPPCRRHAEIASDGEKVYTVQHPEELVVFPNPDVRVGLRAGLMVVRVA